MPGPSTCIRKGTLGKSQAELHQLEERMEDTGSSGFLCSNPHLPVTDDLLRSGQTSQGPDGEAMLARRVNYPPRGHGDPL